MKLTSTERESDGLRGGLDDGLRSLEALHPACALGVEAAAILTCDARLAEHPVRTD